MPPEPVIVNEWIFHYIKGEDGDDERRVAERFLEALLDSPFQIVVLRESRWQAKAWQLWNEPDLRVKIFSKVLYLGILIDPIRCRYLRHDDIAPLPADLADQVPADDIYLFQSALATNASTIVTTDERLINQVPNALLHGIRLQLPQELAKPD